MSGPLSGPLSGPVGSAGGPVQVAADPELLVALAAALRGQADRLRDATPPGAVQTGEPLLDEALADLLRGVVNQVRAHAGRVDDVGARLARAAFWYAEVERILSGSP